MATNCVITHYENTTANIATLVTNKLAATTTAKILAYNTTLDTLVYIKSAGQAADYRYPLTLDNSFNSLTQIASLKLSTAGWVGLGAAAGRLVFTDAAQDTIAFTGLTISGDIVSTPITDYSSTSTVVGWSSFSTKIIKYRTLGKEVTVEFNLEGTSDVDSASFTLPLTHRTEVGYTQIHAGWGKDNGSVLSAPTRVSIQGGTAIITITKDFSGAAFTTSGIKACYGRITYFTD